MNKLQADIEKNCLAQFEKRVDYLAKQAEKLSEEAHKRLLEVKSNPDKLEKLSNKLNAVYAELNLLRQASGRILANNEGSPKPKLLQEMQTMIIKAEKAAGMKVELKENTATNSLERKEVFEIAELSKRLKYKHEMIVKPKLKVDATHVQQIIADVGGIDKIKEEGNRANVESKKIDEYVEIEQNRAIPKA